MHATDDPTQYLLLTAHAAKQSGKTNYVALCKVLWLPTVLEIWGDE